MYSCNNPYKRNTYKRSRDGHSSNYILSIYNDALSTSLEIINVIAKNSHLKRMLIKFISKISV